MGKRIQQVQLQSLGSETLYLGYVGENEHTQIVVNCAIIFTDYPDATASIVVRPPAGDLYHATITRNANRLIWEITSSDVIRAGNGQAQFTFENDGEVIRSIIARTRIDPSIEATGEAPEPLQNWMDQADAKAAEIAQDAARQAAVDVVEEAEAEIERVAGTIPADYTELSDDVDELKSAIDFFDYYVGTVHGKNKYNPETITLNAFINENGVISQNSGNNITDYIDAEIGKKVTVSWRYLFNGNYVHVAKRPGTVVFFDKDKAYISGVFNTDNPTVPNGCAYIRLSLNKPTANEEEYQIEFTDTGAITEYEPYRTPEKKVIADFITNETGEEIGALKSAVTGMSTATASDEGKALKAKTVSGGKVTEWEFGETAAIDDTLSIAGNAADAKATGDAINAISEILDEHVENVSVEINALDEILDEYVETVYGKNEYNPATITANKVINENGDVLVMNGREVTDFISAQAGKLVTVSRKNIASGIQELKNLVYITFYNSNKEWIAGGQFNTNNVEITEGCAFIRVSLETNETYNYQIEFTTNGTYTTYEPYTDPHAECKKDFVTQQTSEIINSAKPNEQVGYASSDNDYWQANHVAETVELVSNTDSSLSIRGITVWDFENAGELTLNNIEQVPGYTGIGRKYRITSSADSTHLYRANGIVSGLIVGRTYRICLKITDPQNNASGGGHYCQIFATKALQSIGNVKVNKEQIFTTTFVATATSCSIYIQPFMTNNAAGYTPSIGDEFTIDDLYINEISNQYDLYTHQKVFSNTANGKVLSVKVNGAMFIASAAYAMVKISTIPSKLLTINGAYPTKDGNVVIKSHLQGKTAVFFGDSVVNKGAGEFSDSVGIVEEITGMQAINAAIGGSALHYRNNTKWDKVGFINMVNMILSGDWSDFEELAADTSFEMYGRVASLLPTMTSVDWNNVDFICINYGGNDISTDPNYSKIDNENDKYDTSTYLGAFRYAIERLTAAYPQIKVLVTTAVFRWWNVDGARVDSDEREMAGGHLYYEWGDALMECAKNEYHYPTLDIYRMLGANKTNYLYYSDDGAHPNQPFINRMGSLFSAAFMSKF